MNKVLKIDKKDNVATCTVALDKGEVFEIDNQEYTCLDNIPRFHKIAIEDLKIGDIVYKYGEIIGDATQDIKKGNHVHIHNLESTRGRGDKGGAK